MGWYAKQKARHEALEAEEAAAEEARKAKQAAAEEAREAEEAAARAEFDAKKEAWKADKASVKAEFDAKKEAREAKQAAAKEAREAEQAAAKAEFDAKKEVWKATEAEQENAWLKANPSAKIVCPQCQVAGYVSTKHVKAKVGVSGGKATGAVLTSGVSLLATGLSRKKKVTRAHCANCESDWEF
jgi:hypothetical protein